LDTGGQPFNVMRAAEYFFVVLTTRPDQFTRFQVADWARASETQLDNPFSGSNYRIVVPDASDVLPMPETMLDLTSTAVVLWDDLSEDALTPLQLSALADWIRFGGRLIVNGPAGSEAFANTSLADLLPLTPTSNIELDGDAATELLTNWSVPSDRTLTKQIESIRSESSRIAIDGRLDSDAFAIQDTSSLVLARRVGRGHVIQPRFDLTDNWIEAWDSYDSFVNAVILNRPPREFARSSLDEEQEDFSESDLSLYLAGTKLRADAAVNTQFRILSRDGVLPKTDQNEEPSRSNSPFDRFSRIDAVTGLSAWNDDSDVLTLMRQTLSSEAGIEIPASGLVIRSLALYLIVLVPVNYIVFRLMNRLEYAWFAVPVIAILGAVWAARQARLDIGFARSNTELAVLEAHAGYRRAHLTRLIGIYNSLSSRYELQFPSVDGIAAPLDNEPDPGTEVKPTIRISFEEGPSLADFAVRSNRVRYVHTEEMIDLRGSFSFDGDHTLSSDSPLELLDGVLIRRSASGATEIAVVGSLVAGEPRTVEFRSTGEVGVASELPMQTTRIIQGLASPQMIPPGETRLVARIDGRIEGVKVTPAASQHSAQTVAVIHLKNPKLPDPAADRNLASDFRRVNKTDEKDAVGDDKKPAGTLTRDAEKE
jgi:hypothetical protein